MRRQLLRTIAIATAVVIALALWRWSPLWPGPALPLHATRLHIETEPLHLVPALACPTALLGPVRVTTADDDLVVVSLDSGKPVRVIWPSGWAAWRLAGRAELVDRWGGIVGREGDVIPARFGGGWDGDDVFHVCMGGW
jgi:hypothetical protein